jgi:glyoxylase-like metal-dependent hydrolase (beta-lactamase superfamily II)
MKPPDLRVISIGTLAAHPLWDERGAVRTGHATTSLVVTDEAKILVDPGLPAPMLQAHMLERTPVRPDEVTHVFVTTFTADHVRGLSLFEHASWYVHAPERAAAREAIEAEEERARDAEADDAVRVLERLHTWLDRFDDADDTLAPHVDLFPLPGVTGGTCGLILSLPSTTTLICGDAVATIEHLRQGKVLPNCVDVEQAQESFREAIEIADILVPGRDNLVHNPLRDVTQPASPSGAVLPDGA